MRGSSIVWKWIIWEHGCLQNPTFLLCLKKRILGISDHCMPSQSHVRSALKWKWNAKWVYCSVLWVCLLPLSVHFSGFMIFYDQEHMKDIPYSVVLDVHQFFLGRKNKTFHHCQNWTWIIVFILCMYLFTFTLFVVVVFLVAMPWLHEWYAQSLIFDWHALWNDDVIHFCFVWHLLY